MSECSVQRLLACGVWRMPLRACACPHQSAPATQWHTSPLLLLFFEQSDINSPQWDCFPFANISEYRNTGHTPK